MSSSPSSFNERRILYEKHTSVPVARQTKAVPGGRFEVCKDVHRCDAIDPWTLDADAIEVQCISQTKVKRDVDCAALWAKKRLWGGTAITEEKFLKMNTGFPCGENLVGRTVCLEAKATIRGTAQVVPCATKQTCSEVPVPRPVCTLKVILPVLLVGLQPFLVLKHLGPRV
ncbi:hypothetical protein BSKO_02506 [Bryopsis sp. KO-2023]|nr:hypothetical protein BSKO_02506 [Bryopsis sp. KO-2023]